MSMAQQIKLYGLTMFKVENNPVNKFAKPLPTVIQLGVGIDGIHIIDPKNKYIIKTFY